MGQISFCRSCAKEITWVRSAAGRPIPCDPKVLTLVTDADDVVKGRLTHFATCPQAKEWSRG